MVVGQRTTKQKVAIADLLEETADFKSAQELHELLKQRGHNIGLATVYRTLQAMVKAQQIDMLQHSDGEAIYRRCDVDDHHHHLVCQNCGSTVEVQVPDMEAWAQAVAAENNYVKINHTIEVFGLCPKCQ